MRYSMLLAVSLLSASTAAYAETVIGVSGALTGPAASSYAPAVEGLRLYVEQMNKAGGDSREKVKLLIQDDQGEPSKAATNARRRGKEGAKI